MPHLKTSARLDRTPKAASAADSAILMLPPKTLSVHELLADVPCWTDGSEDMQSLAADIAARGIDQPIIVTQGDGAFLVIDGRHRLRAACLAGLSEVPVVVRDEGQALEIILGSLTQRRHFNKGALAYLCYPVLEAATHASSGRPQKSSPQATISAEEACARFGFSRDSYFRAAKAHEIFRRRPDLREHFEPLILTGQVGLGAAIAGCAGHDATKGQARNTQPPEQLLLAGFEVIEVRFRAWDKLEGTARRVVTDRAIETVMGLPEEVQESIARALRAARRAA
jgi:hypothetical protein